MLVLRLCVDRECVDNDNLLGAVMDFNKPNADRLLNKSASSSNKGEEEVVVVEVEVVEKEEAEEEKEEEAGAEAMAEEEEEEEEEGVSYLMPVAVGVVEPSSRLSMFKEPSSRLSRSKDRANNESARAWHTN